MMLWIALAFGQDAQRLHPSIRTAELSWTPDPRPLPGGFGLGLFTHYAKEPSVLVRRGARTPQVDDLGTVSVVGGAQLGPVLVGAHLPLHALATGPHGASGLGDARLEGQYTWLERSTVAVGTGLTLSLPTSTGAYLGEGSVTGELDTGVRWSGTRVTWLGNLGVRFRDRVDLPGAAWGPTLRMRTGCVFGTTTTVGAELHGELVFAAPTVSPVEVAAVVQHPLSSSVSVRGAVGTGVTPGFGAPRFRAVLGVRFTPPLSVPETVIERVPVVAPVTTRDGTGPTEVRAVFVDGAGAALSDAEWSLEGEDWIPAGQGVALDTGDYEVVARAPGFRARTVRFTRDESVHQELQFELQPSRVALLEDRITLERTVRFEAGRASIDASSNAILVELADVLLAHPSVQIRIEGHTDNRGDGFSNRRLSLRRALAVKAALVELGVAEDRMDAQGFGEERPLVLEEGEAAWARNRRVEIAVTAR